MLRWRPGIQLERKEQPRIDQRRFQAVPSEPKKGVDQEVAGTGTCRDNFHQELINAVRSNLPLFALQAESPLFKPTRKKKMLVMSLSAQRQAQKREEQ